MPVDLDAARTKLETRRDELTAMSAGTIEDRDTVALDQQSVGRLSRMDSLQQQAMAQATERQRSAELARIKRALAAVDSGDYGFCDSCGDEIPAARIATDPSIAVCVRCATKGGAA